jgi:iron complex transport system permease protein
MAGITSFLLTRADVRAAQEALIWLAGSLNGRTWGNVVPLALASLILVPAALLLGRPLAGLQLGDDLARGLGLPVERSRLLLLLVGVGLAGTATASAGPIAYIAFMSGPIAARLVGGGRPVLLPAGLVGAAIVLAGDFIGSHLLGPTQFPVGVVTGVIGAPYLLWLLATAHRSGRGG